MDEIIRREPAAEEAFYSRQLNIRSLRLRKLIKLNAPKVVIAGEIWLIFLAGIGLCGDHLTQALNNWILARLRAKLGFCERCGVPVSKLSGECMQCKEEEQKYVAEQWDLSDNICCMKCGKEFTYNDLVGKDTDQCPFCGGNPLGT